MSPASCARRWFVLTGLLLVLRGTVFAQSVVPQGGEYSMSGAIGGDQMHPAITVGPVGGLVVWDDNATDPSGLGIRARRLDAASSPIGEPFQINQTMGGDQQHPRVTLLNDGSAFIVWESGKPGSQNISARIVNASGAFVTGEIAVNPPAFHGYVKSTTNWVLIHNNKPHPHQQKIRELVNERQESNVNPGAATLADGSVVVVYSSSRKSSRKKGYALSETITWNEKKQIFITNRKRVRVDSDVDYMQDVYFQRFSATGQKLGVESVANSLREFNQRNASVAALGNGGFVVCWVSEVPVIDSRINTTSRVHGGGNVDVLARIFGADGQPAGPEFRVNTSTLPCGAPVVAGQNGGGFTLAWVQRDQARGNGFDVLFRSFDSVGSPQGDPVVGNTRTFGDQFAPSIATIGAQQILVWSSMGQDGSWEGVYGQLLQGGSTVGAEFRVNTTTYMRQIHPAVTGGANGAVVVWSGYAFDSGFDVFAQRYSAP